jgi:sulfite reductase (NADPH) hemoprotein beta-component
MTDEVSRNERIKEASDYLRGTLAEGLREEITGAIVEDDQQLVKFHGMYLQDDRDLRPEHTRKKMEKAFAFMIRVRIPGGVLSGAQWLALDHVARTYGNGTMRLTTRQTVQLHGVIKSNLKATLKEIDAVLLGSIAACGDVNRNVMCNPNPEQSRAHAKAIELARAISDHLTPRTPAYREIWLDGERITGGEEGVIEPIYGKTYLPRKFKIVLAVPPSNDVDVFAHDLGFIAILGDKGEVTGWNITVGGGMGMTPMRARRRRKSRTQGVAGRFRCSRKKRSISLAASGPRGSVKEPAELPPDQACPAPWISQCSNIARPLASVWMVRV